MKKKYLIFLISLSLYSSNSFKLPYIEAISNERSIFVVKDKNATNKIIETIDNRLNIKKNINFKYNGNILKFTKVENNLYMLYKIKSRCFEIIKYDLEAEKIEKLKKVCLAHENVNIKNSFAEITNHNKNILAYQINHKSKNYLIIFDISNQTLKMVDISYDDYEPMKIDITSEFTLVLYKNSNADKFILQKNYNNYKARKTLFKSTNEIISSVYFDKNIIYIYGYIFGNDKNDDFGIFLYKIAKNKKIKKIFKTPLAIPIWPEKVYLNNNIIKFYGFLFDKNFKSMGFTFFEIKKGKHKIKKIKKFKGILSYYINNNGKNKINIISFKEKIEIFSINTLINKYEKFILSKPILKEDNNVIYQLPKLFEINNKKFIFIKLININSKKIKAVITELKGTTNQERNPSKKGSGLNGTYLKKGQVLNLEFK